MDATTPATPDAQTVEVDALDAQAHAAALEAQAYAAQAVKAATAQVDALRRERDGLAEYVTVIEDARSSAQRELDAARVQTARAMGYQAAAELDDAELLKLLPSADPRTLEGRAEWERHRQRNPRAYRLRGIADKTLSEAVAIVVPTPEGGLFSGQRLVSSLFGGRRP